MLQGLTILALIVLAFTIWNFTKSAKTPTQPWRPFVDNDFPTGSVVSKERLDELRRRREGDFVEPVDVSDDYEIQQPFSVADEILKFKKLCDEGIITQEEFELKKKQLLEYEL